MSQTNDFDIQLFEDKVLDRLTALETIFGSPPNRSFTPEIGDTEFRRLPEKADQTVETLENIGYKYFEQMNPMLFAMTGLWGEYLKNYEKRY